MNNILILLMPLFLILSCKKDDPPTETHELSNCLLNDTPIDFSTSGCIDAPLDTSQFCEKVIFDGAFFLRDKEKAWLPYYCCEIGDRIFFIDELGDEISFTVSDKEYGLGTRGINGFDACDSSPDKPRLYCINSTFAWVSFFSNDIDFQMTVTLNVEFESPLSEAPKTGASIDVSTFEVVGTTINSTTHFYAVVENDEFNNPPMDTYFDEIEILGETFQDVYTYVNPIDTNFIQMFYNQEIGIISLIDNSGKQWLRK